MGLPLSTLLSQALVAFTIEADHGFELRMPHCTAESRKRGEPVVGPWLISTPFLANGLQHVHSEGMTVGELEDEALLAVTFLRGSNPGLVRWGYLRLEPGEASPKKLGRDWTLVPTANGRLAQRTWAPIPSEIDARWTERWPGVAALRAVLEEVVAKAPNELPDHLPVNGGHDGCARWPSRPPKRVLARDLGTLLAKALLLFTVDVESASPVALVHSANVLRVLAAGEVHQRDLPARMGVGKETVAVMTGALRRQGFVAVSPANEVRLTAAGREALETADAVVAAIEESWPDQLRRVLEPLVGDGTVAGSPLAAAIDPPPGTWRHRRPPPTTLPHHPVVSHRGGYPDGS